MARKERDPYEAPPMYHDRSGGLIRVVIMAGLVGAGVLGWAAYSQSGPGHDFAQAPPEAVAPQQQLAEAPQAVAPTPMPEATPAPAPATQPTTTRRSAPRSTPRSQDTPAPTTNFDTPPPSAPPSPVPAPTPIPPDVTPPPTQG